MKKKPVLIILTLITTILASFIFAFATYFRGYKSVEEEWNSKLPETKRPPEVIRALIDNMYAYKNDLVPSFVPQSGWDNQLCAANIVGAVNFILGKEILKMAPAWKFSAENSANLSLVYKREKDFVIDETAGTITETKDRVFWLSSILKTVGQDNSLTSDRIYIVGYRYNQTLSNRSIIEAGGTINSHLMLILGRYDGSWWGYHMFHDPNEPDKSPFRIDSLGESMPEMFDLVYIWEVLGTEMPRQGTTHVMVQNMPPYQTVRPKIGWLGFLGLKKIQYFLDTIAVQLWSDGEQFPRVVVPQAGVVDVVPPTHKGTRHSELLGFYNKVAIRHHSGTSMRGTYGLEYQCVEFVNRYYAKVFKHFNMTGSGDADTYFYSAKYKNLVQFENEKLPEPPMVGDILVFDPPGTTDTNPGHVGIVYYTDSKRVCLVQQNMDRWRGCLPLQNKNGAWYVGAVAPNLPCTGWTRKKGK